MRVRFLKKTYLDALFFQVHGEGELLAEQDVGVVRLQEGGLELLELLFREDGAVATLPLAVGRRHGGDARAD